MKKLIIALLILGLPLLLSNCASNPCSGGGGCGGGNNSDSCCGQNSYTGNWY